MTKQTINTNSPDDLINVGNSANDRKGDSLRAAFIKLNDAVDKIDSNFTELYARPIGGSGGSIIVADQGVPTLGQTSTVGFAFNEDQLDTGMFSPDNGHVELYSNARKIFEGTDNDVSIITSTSDYSATNTWHFDRTGGLTFPDGLTVADSIIGRRVETPTEGGVDAIGAKLSASDTSVALEAYNDPVGSNNKQYSQVLLGSSQIELKTLVEDLAGETGTTVLIGGNTFRVTQGDGVISNQLNFTDGDLTVDNNIIQRSHRTLAGSNITVAQGSTTVIFSAPQWTTSIKLIITAEGRVDGDQTGVDHTQTCEATIAATYNTSAEPVMSVYGSVYTSVAPLATFTINRGVGNSIEVSAVNSQAANDLYVKVHAIQVVSRFD